MTNCFVRDLPIRIAGTDLVYLQRTHYATRRRVEMEYLKEYRGPSAPIGSFIRLSSADLLFVSGIEGGATAFP